MVKYGKEYKRLQLDEWKKYYLNYKTLKHKIKEMRQILFKDLKLKPNEGRPSLLSIPLIPDDLNEIENTKSNENLSSLYKDEKGELLKEFIEFLKSNVALIAESILLVASIAGIIVYTKDAKVITAQILELVAAAGLLYNLYKR